MTTTTHGFTSDTLGWRAWLDTVSLDAATPMRKRASIDHIDDEGNPKR